MAKKQPSDARSKILLAVIKPKYTGARSRIDDLPDDIRMAVQEAIQTIAINGGNRSALAETMADLGYPEITDEVLRAAVKRATLARRSEAKQ